MKALLYFAAFCVIALAANGSAQDSKKESAKGEITKAMFWVPNQH